MAEDQKKNAAEKKPEKKEKKAQNKAIKKGENKSSEKITKEDKDTSAKKSSDKKTKEDKDTSAKKSKDVSAKESKTTSAKKDDSSVKESKKNTNKDNQKKKTKKKKSKDESKGKHVATKDLSGISIGTIFEIEDKDVAKKDADKDNHDATLEAIDKEREEKISIVLEKQSERNQEREAKINAKRKQKRNWKIAGIVTGSVIGVYALGVILFSIFTFPNTFFADNDLSFKLQGDIQNIVAKYNKEYSLDLEGPNFQLTIPGKDIDYNFDEAEVAKNISSKNNAFAWPYEIFVVHDFKDDFVVSFNQEKVANICLPAFETHNSTAKPPADAGFNIDPVLKTVAIREEVYGDTIKPAEALVYANECIGQAKQHAELTDNEVYQPVVVSDDPRIENALAEAKTAINSSITYVMGTCQVGVIDAKALADWLIIDSNYSVTLEPTKLTVWASNIAETYDSVGSTRTYVTPYGKTATVSGGSIGWLVDVDGLMDSVTTNSKTGTVQVLDVPCLSKLNGYTGPGNRDWGARYIDVDLAQQHARFYNDAGSLIWETDIVSGKPDGEHNTPTGVYKINNKQSPSILVAADDSYHTKVQYWMAFVGNGVGFHDATWQSSFGGSRYAQGFGSHGCVNISLSAAGSLYSLCETGDVVVVHQ